MLIRNPQCYGNRKGFDFINIMMISFSHCTDWAQLIAKKHTYLWSISTDTNRMSFISKEYKAKSPFIFTTQALLSEIKAGPEELLSTSAHSTSRPLRQKNKKSLVEKMTLLREAIHRNKWWNHMIPKLNIYSYQSCKAARTQMFCSDSSPPLIIPQSKSQTVIRLTSAVTLA